MSHYYSQQPDVDHQLTRWSFTLNQQLFTFETDNGVFSKKVVDYGSRVLIENFQNQQLPTGSILDMGCGYGPIGLAIAKQNPTHTIEMVDINERAVALAKKNALLNQINNIDIHQSNLYDGVHQTNYAAIVSNPPIRAGKSVVHEILSNAHDLLLPTGTLTIVIQKKQGAPSAKEKMQAVFGNAEILKKDKGYYIIQSRKQALSF